jgi:hypothetical protein
VNDVSRTLRILACSLLVSSCGGGNDGPPGDAAGDVGPTYGPCEERPDPGSVTHVDLRVSSPLPAELSTGCAQGAVSDLSAYLSIPTEDPCWLDVSSSGVTGCCAQVDADQNTYVDLNFRSSARALPLATQSKFMELPTTSPPVLGLTFAGITPDESWYDTDDDGTGNMTEWCAGTL